MSALMEVNGQASPASAGKAIGGIRLKGGAAGYKSGRGGWNVPEGEAGKSDTSSPE